MTESKRKSRARKKVKHEAVQRTLKDMMFGNRTSSLNSVVPSMNTDVEEMISDSTQDKGISSEEINETSAPSDIDHEPSPQRSIRPIPTSRIPASQPTRMFSIFEKPKIPSSPQPIEVLDSPVPELFDITNEGESSPMVGSRSQGSSDARTSMGTSQENPIVVVSSPSKHPSSLDGPMWSIFQRKDNRLPVSLRGKQKEVDDLPIAFPDSTSQHIRGPQTQFSPADIPFTPRVYQRDHRMEPSFVGDFSNLLCDHTVQQAPIISDSNFVSITHTNGDSAFIQSIPRLHQRYPAISRSLSHVNDDTSLHSSISQEAWTEKWRPRRADEVIGNEAKALYLRDWLTAMKLKISIDTDKTRGQGKKSKKRRPGRNGKPEVVRHIKKKRRMDDGLGGFLASDDEDESQFDYVTDIDRDELDFLSYSGAATPETSSRYSSPLSQSVDDTPGNREPALFAYTPPNFGSRIHNTILLAGPSGCGKTAAVYACAEELGWEVFEVYSGIGERSGTELNRLIGDIGRNHIVHSTLRHSPKRQHAYFSRAKSEKTTIIHVDSDDDDDEVRHVESLVHEDALFVPVVEPKIPQSLVLIEEVDILYNNDAGFWPALINIIKDCRRPVVMTCNDITLVPYSDLPLQTTLHFTPCPSDLAGSYLQASCLSEGFTIGRHSALSLYDGCADLPSERCSRARDFCRSDLRFSINQLQYWSSILPLTSATSGSTPAPTVPAIHMGTEFALAVGNDDRAEKDREAMRQAFQLRETISYVEDQLLRDPAYFAEELHNESSDVESGYTVLPLELLPHPPSVSAFYTQDCSLARDVVSLSQRGCQVPGSQHELSVEQLEYDMLAFRNPISDVLFHCLQPMPSLSDRSVLFTDYLPWIRYMVKVDNAVEELISPPGTQPRRQTRTSKRAAQERHIPLDAGPLELLARTAFRISDPEDG